MVERPYLVSIIFTFLLVSGTGKRRMFVSWSTKAVKEVTLQILSSSFKSAFLLRIKSLSSME